MATSDTKSVDSALWWEPFSSILTDLENESLSSDIPSPLAKKLKENHEWFVETVARFRPPSDKSREALNSKKLKIGSHEITIRPHFRDKALEVSSYLCLDEVQSYILVERFLEHGSIAVDFKVQEPVHMVLVQYYVERQCLLKCTRQILLHALCFGNGLGKGNLVSNEAMKLISDGLESKLISVLQTLYSTNYPEQMDVDVFTLWAEETLNEDNLVLDIIFLLYYESFCVCNSEKWKRLCLLYKGILSGSGNFGKLEISTEALYSSYCAKVRLLLILIETLNLENLLQMVHDEVPFRQGAYVFSLTDVQEIDALISSFDDFEMKDTGPLVLTWAVFLCLVFSLPGKEDNNMLLEIDHTGYARQAFEAQSLSYFLEILQSGILKESDGPVSGYRSVLRTFISAFIASYEINLQIEDKIFNLIFDILCNIYREEESLCVQFWDRASFVDGPIRCLLCSIEGEFPFRTVEFVSLLSALSEGSWPSTCVFNFLDKSVGISSLFEISSESLVDNQSQIVETRHPVFIPGVDALCIPSGSRGHILRIVNGNTALVRWENTQSAILVLLLRLAKGPYSETEQEILCFLDLLRRMVSFNTAVCIRLMNVPNPFCNQRSNYLQQLETSMWVVDTICSLVRNLSSTPRSAALMSMALVILSQMLKCSPSHVAAVALKTNIFDVASKTNVFDSGWNGLSSGSWLLSGKLAKMILLDCEQNNYDCPLAISVLDFTLQLVQIGVEDDIVLSLVVFSLQYVLVNHEFWKYKEKNTRWKVTLKVLELVKTCILSLSSSKKLGAVVQDLLLCDSSIHSTLFRIICTTSEDLEKLYVNRYVQPAEINGLQVAIGSTLDILYMILHKFDKDVSSSLPAFLQVVLFSKTKPVPVVTAIFSLLSYHRDPAIQVNAAKVLYILLTVADLVQPNIVANAFFALDDVQIADIGFSMHRILHESEVNEDLFVAVVCLLASAARYQPAFIVAIFGIYEAAETRLSDDNDDQTKQQTARTSLGASESEKTSLLYVFLQYVERSDGLIHSNQRILLSLLSFLKALWQGAARYMAILESLKNSEKFWKQLSNAVSRTANLESPELELMTEQEALQLGYKYQCQSALLEIMACDMFIKKKLLHAESLVKEDTKSNARLESAPNAVKAANLEDVFSSWCESSTLGNLMMSYTSCKYSNILYRTKVAFSLLTVHIIEKLAAGSCGSLSVSMLEKIHFLSEKLISQPAFSELSAQYLQRGYSEGRELKALIINDLYYHLQGEFDGRKIGPGPFKELCQFLVESNFLQMYEQNVDLFAITEDVRLFDLSRIRADLGLNLWDYSEWKASKAVAETLLFCLEEANSMVLIANSRLSALKALISALTVYEGDSLAKRANNLSKIPESLAVSCIDHICQCFHVMLDSVAPMLTTSEDVIDFLAADAQLLLLLMRSMPKKLSSLCVLILKTSHSCLKVLSDLRPMSNKLKETMKLLLMLILLAVESSGRQSQASDMKNKESAESFADIANASLGLLPNLCNCITVPNCSTLSLTAIDRILQSFLTPNTWFPIIQKHIALQYIVLKLQDKHSIVFAPIILKFFLTLAHVRGGAEMLVDAGLLSSLRVLFVDSPDGRSSAIDAGNSVLLSETIEKPQQIWGLGLSVVTAVIHSLGDSSLCVDFVENVISYFFSEKAHLISHYLSYPGFSTGDHDKKQPCARSLTSLTSFKDLEHTLMLMCTLARHWSLWVKAMKDMDSTLREMTIHLLAFISRGSQHFGEAPVRAAPLLCPPRTKEEFDSCNRPSIVNSKNGWFALAPVGCVLKPKFSSAATTTELVSKGQAIENSNYFTRTYFSDSVAIQIYRVTFLVLKFLCLQAAGAARRAEELGFIDIAHFPELPMPEILHGMQDQAAAIVTEICETHASKQMNSDVQQVCLLLLQIMEMALYLELCVLHICGISPVLGRVEDFPKQIKQLIKVTEGHDFLNLSMKSLKQITSLLYPGLL